MRVKKGEVGRAARAERGRRRSNADAIGGRNNDAEHSGDARQRGTIETG